MDQSKMPISKKSFDIRYYFQTSESVDLNQLQMTHVSTYSTTPWRESNFITRTILNFYNGTNPIIETAYDKLPIVTDSTSNCGGNTISFHLSGGFKKINAVEIDMETCNMLKNNLKTYHMPIDNVYCCDYLSVYKNLRQDVIFLDPPWGGADYKKTPCLDLYLSNINIIDLCFDIITNEMASLLVLKLPINYNLPQLINILPNNTFLTHKIYRGHHHSYNVVFCW